MDLSSVSANELARICGQTGDNDAWREFVRRFQPPIALSVLRTARRWGIQSPSVLDDLVQETFFHLCDDNRRLLRSFSPREPDSVIGYLKVVAANVTHDKLRADRTLKRGGALERFEVEPNQLDSIFVSSRGEDVMEKSIRHKEIDQALRSFVPERLSERDRTIFWLYFEQGFSAREIGTIASIGLSVKGVESSIHRTTQHLREALLPRRAAGGALEGISKPPTIYEEEP
jgi:RNA polymerase sigma-70 factor (ECF subfamily)